MKSEIKAVVVGYGNRGETYCKYAITNHDLKIVGVVDPRSFRRELARTTFNIPEENCFETLEEFLSREKFADCVINATMDELHIATAIPILKKRYDMLLEKPITSNRDELLEIESVAKETKTKLVICHALRYTPFYRSIKEIVARGEIGKIIHIETNEAVGVAHASSAYIRGKWKNSIECGSSMLLAKCCHDLDLLCWLNNETQPVSVASFGGRHYFTPENAPEGSGTRCLKDCSIEVHCPYSARKMYIEKNAFPQLVWAKLDKKAEEISRDERIEFIKEVSPHGECVFKTNADIVDRQTLILKYANGSIASHTMLSAISRPGRKIHIYGTEGEIEGFFEDSRFVVRKYNPVSLLYDEKEYLMEGIERGDGHMGGDSRIVRDFVSYLKGNEPSISMSGIEDSINSHLCVYAADESMETCRIVPVVISKK